MGNSIVVLSGSPRRGAATDRLAAAFIEGAEQSGKTVRCFRAADMKVAGCLGCGSCLKNSGQCVQKDDMQAVLEALQQADTVVLASPVYYFGVTAQLKLVIDRFYALLRVGMPVKRAALLMTCGGGAEAADSSISMFRQISKLLKWEEAGIVIAPRLHRPDEIVGRGELNEAKLLGQNI